MDETRGQSCRAGKAEAKRDISDLCHRTERQQLLDVVLVDGEDRAEENSGQRERNKDELGRKAGKVGHTGEHAEHHPRDHV